jgi:hypothetical protein
VLRSKTALRLLVGRIKLLSNKKAASQKALRREIAELCGSGKMDSARIRVRPRTASSSSCGIRAARDGTQLRRADTTLARQLHVLADARLRA